MADQQNNGSRSWSDGKIHYQTYPDVYFEFVKTLHKEHKDLLDAMTLAQVKFEDGSAVLFLNTFLGTSVTREMPMDLGFPILLDALNMRVVNKIGESAMKRVAKEFKDHSVFPSRSDPSKPLFPDEPNQ